MLQWQHRVLVMPGTTQQWKALVPVSTVGCEIQVPLCSFCR